MVAMDGGGHGDALASGLHELQQGHLRRGVLHGDAVRSQIDPAAAARDVGARRIIEVSEEDLFRQRQVAAQPAAHQRETFGERCVEFADGIDHHIHSFGTRGLGGGPSVCGRDPRLP